MMGPWILAAVFVFWVDIAHAQIGNIFTDPGTGRSNGRPVDRYAKAAWDQLPSPLLSCVDATLQRDRSSINDLIRQSIYPNNPQLRDITARCEQNLKPKVEQPNLAMREWSSMSLSSRNCVDNELHREQGTTVEALIAQGIRPSDYRLQTMRDFCNAPAGAASASRPSSGGPDAKSQAFAQWLTTSVLTRPIFAKSFNQCREIVSLYQDKNVPRSD